MKTGIALAMLSVLITVSAAAGVIDNDATCDIKVGPAATLLLHYFEVDLYLNLNNGGSTGYSITTRNGIEPPKIVTGAGSTSIFAPSGSQTVGPRPSQNWVTITMFGNLGTKHLVAEFDAASLGNGCTPASVITSSHGGNGTIGPGGGVFVCPPGTPLSDGTTALCKGTDVNAKP